jgi:hypothetical protein
MPTTDTPEAPTTLADDLRASYEKLTAEAPDDAPEVDSPEAPPDEEAAPSVESEPTEPKADKTGRLHRPDGKFAPKAGEAPAAAAPAAKVVPKPALAPVAPETPAVGPKVDAQPAPAAVAKAPSSWRPEVREKWASLPEDVRNEINRREREISTGLGQTAPYRQKAETWDSVTGPYEMMFRADGMDAPKAVGGLLQFAAALRTSPEPQKAAMVAGLIKNYGVTVDSLAKALDGAQAGVVPPAAPEYRDPRVDQLLAHFQTQARTQQEATRAAAAKEVEDFKASDSPLAEFFDDMAEDIADQLEFAHKRGQSMTVAQAAERAARLNDGVSGVLAQRKAAADAKAKAAELARKRGAARSIQPFPSAPPPGEEGDTDGSLRGDLEMVTRKLASGGRT